MKLKDAEKLLVETLFQTSIESEKIPNGEIKKVVKLTGDASTRRYYRAQTENGSYVVCLNDSINNKKQESEFIEVQKILKNHNIRVPLVFDYNLEKGYILEEDLGDQTMLRELGYCEDLRKEKCLYEVAIEQMIRVQKLDFTQYYGRSFSSLAFDVSKLMEEVQFTIEHFVKGFLNHPLDKQDESILISYFLKISKKLADQKMVLNHRDYHSRNIMIKEDQQVVIDFQDARLGVAQYDLVSLLEDCYYSIEISNKCYLKDFYWNDFIKEESIQSSKEEFYLLYDFMSIQRIFKAIGSFSFIYQTRKDFRYLKYISHSFENLKKFLYIHEDLKELRMALSRIYYEY